MAHWFCQLEHSGKARWAWSTCNFFSGLSGSASVLCATLMSLQRTKLLSEDDVYSTSNAYFLLPYLWQSSRCSIVLHDCTDIFASSASGMNSELLTIPTAFGVWPGISRVRLFLTSSIDIAGNLLTHSYWCVTATCPTGKSGPRGEIHWLQE